MSWLLHDRNFWFETVWQQPRGVTRFCNQRPRRTTCVQKVVHCILEAHWRTNNMRSDVIICRHIAVVTYEVVILKKASQINNQCTSERTEPVVLWLHYLRNYRGFACQVWNRVLQFSHSCLNQAAILHSPSATISMITLPSFRPCHHKCSQLT